MTSGLLATVALLALLSSSALAATKLTVTETTDAPLSSGASTCESTDVAKGCTLRAAVELADSEGNETDIALPEGEYVESLGALKIEDAGVTIDGEGASDPVISGEEKDSVLEVKEDSELALHAVTIEHGDAEEGGGIFVAGEAFLLLEQSVVTENTANADGGGVFGADGSLIEIEDSTINKNTSDGTGGGVYAGSEATAAIEGSEITDNFAFYDGGGVYGQYFASVLVTKSTVSENHTGFYGGGIYSEVGSSLTVRQSTVADNGTLEGGGGIASGVGEGESCVGARGSGVKRARSSGAKSAAAELAEGLTIEQSTIDGNYAEAGDGGGVGIYVELNSGCGGARAGSDARPAKARLRSAIEDVGEEGVLIAQSTIAHNTADEGDSEAYPQGLGGGIYEEGFYEDPIVNSTIADNGSARDGAGVAVTDHAAAVLVSDTVFGNAVEPLDIQTEAGAHGVKSAHPDAVSDAAEVGNNLAADNEDGEEATIDLRDTIVAEPAGDEVENCEGEIESLVPGFGYNLDYPTSTIGGSTDTCGLSAADNDLVGEKPGLDEAEGLTNNGGPTDTIALLSTSPAIGVVPVAEDCEESENGPASVDQRGEPRPGIPGKGCDVGAYEYQGNAEEPPKKTEVKNEEPKKEEKPAATGTATTSVLPFVSSTPAQQCLSQRDITIHIQNAKQFGIVSAVVSIDGHHTRTLTGKRLITAINLRGLPKGTFTVEIVAHTRSGHTLRGKRVYHTCHTKLPGHSYLRL
jgi:hypothetical protein